MEFLQFFDKFNGYAANIHKQDDDMVCRLNHKYTCALVLVFLVFIAAKQYVGQPIECWVPRHFSGVWQAYAESYCWIKNTYFVPHANELPGSEELHERSDAEIGYYQWVPFFLCGLILWNNIPFAIWKILYSQAGIHVQSIISMANDVSNIESETRQKNMEIVARYVEDAIFKSDKTANWLTKIRRTVFWCFSRQRFGNYLTFLYIFVKFLYLLNVFLQFFILNRFINTSYNFYGIQMLRDLYYNRDWTESGHFPRVTMCDFSIRALGQKTHNYTVQCVLMINLFNEKVFLFLWFWYLLVALITAYSFFTWTMNSFLPSRRVAYIKNFIKLSREYSRGDEKAVEDFTLNRIQSDGVLLIRLIRANAGDIVSTDIVKHLWIKYKPISAYIKSNSDEAV